LKKGITFTAYSTQKSNTIMSKIFDEIKQKIAEVESDVRKFNDGNNAAGGRVRKAMQDIKKLAQDLRQEVLTVKEARADQK
jgi:predicted transcriptional regulator